MHYLSDWKILSPVIIATTGILFLILERFFPYDKGQKVFRKGWFNDFVLYTLVQSYVLGLVINAFIAWIDEKTGASRLHLFSGYPLWAQMLFFFVTHDFYIYWAHRLQHTSPIFWRLHEAHHSVENVDWLAGSRSHALEILVNQTIEFAPIVLLGAPPELALMKGTIDAVWGMFIHANLNIKAGRVQLVLNGPEGHRWHHSKHWRGHGFNFGTKLAIWDWMFGTLYLPNKKPEGYGLIDPNFPENFILQQLFAFRRFGKKDFTPEWGKDPEWKEDAPAPAEIAA
ncbi:MAG: sterol desaturase family protein [Byssovorax sp.]